MHACAADRTRSSSRCELNGFDAIPLTTCEAAKVRPKRAGSSFALLQPGGVPPVQCGPTLGNRPASTRAPQ
jgi:hypothetical protein